MGWNKVNMCNSGKKKNTPQQSKLPVVYFLNDYTQPLREKQDVIKLLCVFENHCLSRFGHLVLIGQRQKAQRKC